MSTGQERKGSRGWIRLIAAVVVIAAGVLAARHFGLFEQLTLDNVEKLDAWFRGFGIWAPIIFIGVWIVACVFFLPGLPVTIVGALIFGPIKGTIFSLIGATLGATAAFLVGRYAARDMVEELVKKNRILQKIDEGVEKQGWRMLMITRLVPIFPFNAQNYVYGLTKIRLSTYVIVSAICMLPGTIMFNFAAGSIRSGNFGRAFVYIAIAAVVFVILSLLPGWIRKRFGADELLEENG